MRRRLRVLPSSAHHAGRDGHVPQTGLHAFRRPSSSWRESGRRSRQWSTRCNSPAAPSGGRRTAEQACSDSWRHRAARILPVGARTINGTPADDHDPADRKQTVVPALDDGRGAGGAGDGGAGAVRCHARVGAGFVLLSGGSKHGVVPDALRRDGSPHPLLEVQQQRVQMLRVHQQPQLLQRHRCLFLRDRLLRLMTAAEQGVRAAVWASRSECLASQSPQRQSFC